MTRAGGLQRGRVAMAIVALLVAALAFAMIPLQSRAEPIVPFTSRFSTDDNGTISVFGNNLMTCPATDSRCAGAQRGSPALNNNGFSMVNLDADAVAGTFNSSAVGVTAPANAEVLWAGLYWGARLSKGTGGVAATGNRKIMQLRGPGGDYAPVTSQVGFGPTSGDQAYQEFANVTALVKAAGPGTYWGANVVAGTGEDRYAGWSLVVVYRAPGLPLRNLTVFDGFADVGRDEPQTVNLSGFRTPVTGPVETQLGMVAYEGDYSTSGDNARLNGTLLSTSPLSSGSNFFNGTNDDNGVSVQNRTPAHLNMLGYDVKNLAASGIPNGATSATISLESTGDRYFPGVVTTAIRLFAPDFTTSTKTVSNLAGRTPALPGDELEYTLTYPNTGQDPATNVSVADTLPPGTTFVSATPSSGTCTGSNRDVSCTIGTIGVGATWQATVRAVVDPAAAGTTLTNAAVLSYRAATLGRDLTYVVAPATIDVAAVADLSIAKTMSPDPGTAGGQVTAVLTVANAGPSPAAGTVVTDQLPAGTTFVSADPGQGTCTAASGVLTCALGTVADGDEVAIDVVLGVPPGYDSDTIVNVASVQSATSDPDGSDNSAGASIAVTRAADLRVTKTASASTAVPGDSVTFTVTVVNDGPSNAADVTATDTISDPALVITGATAPGATCTAGATVAQCSQPVLVAGESLVMTVRARVSPDAAAGLAIEDTATVAASTPDPDPDDNSATATVTTADPQADLSTSKVGSDAVAGGQTSYSVAVTNHGPSTAAAVTVEDLLPAGLTAVSVVSTRGDCTTNQPVTCDLGSLPGPDPTGTESSATITVIADVAPGVAPGPIVNSAVASSPTSDPDPADNTGTATTTVSAVADVSVTKTATPVQPAAGEDVTFTVTVANAGPSVAAATVLTDALPPGLTLLGVDAPAGVSCDGSSTLTCAIGSLDPGGSVVISVRMNVPSDFDLDVGAVNTADVSSDALDPATGNNSATATITTRAISDLLVLKWDTTDFPTDDPPRAFNAGETVTYHLAAGNLGPSDASTARVVDTLPPGVTFVSSVPECTFVPPNQVVCDLPTVPNQFAALFPVTVRVDSDLAEGTFLTNSATIELTDPDRVDPVSSNNFAAVTNPVTTLADLSVAKQTYSLELPEQTFTSPSAAPAGTPTGYGIDVRNDGPSVARDAVLVDSSTMTDFFLNAVRLIRPGEDPVDITAQCSFSGGDLQCPLGDLPVFAAGDASWRIQVDGVTLSNAVAGSYVNTATVTSATPETDTTDNVAQAPITVTDPVATLTIDKTVLGGTDVNQDGTVDIVPGGPFAYQIVVENILDLNREGAADAPDVVVTDTLPAGLVATSATSTQGTCDITPPSTVTCQLGTVLGPGRVPAPPAVTITVSGMAASSLGTGAVLTNSATVTSPISADATDAVSQDVIALADVSASKVADTPVVAAGAPASFSIVVTNSGPSDAEFIDIADLLPPELVFDPAGSDPRCNLATEQGTTYVQCLIGTIPTGESRTVRISATTSPDQAPTTVTNVAFAASQIVGGDSNFDNNRAEAPVDIIAQADLIVTKIADAESRAVGEVVTYTVSATNAGPSNASDVVLTDPIPAGLEFVSAEGGDGVTCVLQGTDVVCTAPSVAAGAAATATIALRLPVGLEPGQISNTVTATTSTSPPIGDDSATAVVNAFILADTAIEKSVVTENPVAGEPVVFALDVVNRGPQSAPRVVVSDSLPTGMTFLSAQVPGGGSCAVTAPEGIDIVTCNLGAMDVGATMRVLMTVDTDPSLTTVTNGAFVGASALDESSADNFDDVAFALAAPVNPEPTPTPTPTPAPAAGEDGTALPPTGGSMPLAEIGFGFLAVAIGLLLIEWKRRRAND